MSKFTDRLQRQMKRNNSEVDVARVLKTKNGTSRTKFSKGDPVKVFTEGRIRPAEIVSTETSPYYWLSEDSYLCRFENGATEYIKAEWLRLNWNEKENKPPQRNTFGEIQDNIDNGEVIRLI